MDWVRDIPRWAWITVGAVILLLVAGLVGLSCDNAKLQVEKTAAQNAAAKADRLKIVAENESTTLRERFAYSDRELDYTLLQNELLTGRLKAQEADIKSITKIATEFRIENEKLKGVKGRDSLGFAYADFDTATTDYQISARVQIDPVPVMDIKSFFVVDSTYISHYETKDGMLHGVIARKNKHVFDYGAEFFIKLGDSEDSVGLASIYWIFGGILIVGSFLVGLSL